MTKTAMEMVFLLEYLCGYKYLLIQVSWELLFLVDIITVVLLYFQLDILVCHMNSGRRHETPGSEMRDDLFLEIVVAGELQ